MVLLARNGDSDTIEKAQRDQPFLDSAGNPNQGFPRTHGRSVESLAIILEEVSVIAQEEDERWGDEQDNAQG